MKKRILSFVLVAVMLLGMIPMQALAVTGSDALAAVDTSWYDATAESGTVFELADAADLRGAAKLSQSGVTFKGYTLKLTADIDLNPGWDAEVKVVDGKAVLPATPAVEFAGFATFSGTLDGNGKTLSGVYMTRKLTASSANLGFIEILDSGVVKNLIMNNSFIFAEISDGCNDCKVGGIAARMNGTTPTIDTVYADIDVWYRAWSYQRLGGIAAKTGGNSILQNVAFAGRVGYMNPGTNEVTTKDNHKWISQLLAHADWKSNTIVNCSLMGTEYVHTSVGTGNYDLDAGGSAVHTNVLVGADVALPAAVAAMNPKAYAGTLAEFNVWPSATADRNTASYDNVRYYSSATEANYTSYLSALETAGYTKAADYTVGSNKYALYQKVGEYSVYVSYLAKVGTFGNARMRVSVEPFGAEYNVNSTATTANVCTPQVWQLDVDNMGSKQDGGMSYVIRLTDGTFVVIDGGYSTDAEAKNLYQVLSANNVNSGKPVVTAWFITHAHGDHCGVIKNFAKNYASSVTVEAFYYNLPTSEVKGTENTDIVTVAAVADVENMLKSFGGASKYSKLHSGMTFGFAGATATVLGTYEDVKQSYYKNSILTANDFKDGNDTSTVIKFTIGEQTLMILGDARTGMSKQLEYTYPASVLKSDMVQMSHHGYTGVQDSLLENIDADVVLWPMDVVASNEDKLFEYYLNNTGDLDIAANDYVRKNANEIIPAYENACLAIPYAATTYSGGKTVDLKKAYNDKLYRIATEGNGPDTSWYSADKSVYYIYDANDLLGFANLAAAGNNFAGKTVMLMANIDLNPGWDASVTIGDTVVFPNAPANVWPEIATFSGTIDGNGYTLSGLYKYMTAKGGSGAHGGMFNTFSGTVKNIRIENSFVAASNTDWSSKNVRVGGIGGTVTAGATLTNVYMDIEVWYKSHEGCMLGGAFGGADGQYNVDSFIFAGRVGHTNNSFAKSFTLGSGKNMWLGQLTGNQNWKEDNTIKNVAAIGVKFVGAVDSAQSGFIGTDLKWNYKYCYTDKKDLTYSGAQTMLDAGWIWNDTLKCLIPGANESLVENTYSHIKADNTSKFTSTLENENTYLVYTAEELLAVINKGGDFAGKTIMLMANIDLNPGWDASVTIGDTVVFPNAPANVWPEIATFKGTLDGNGYTLSGLYKYMTAKGGSGAHGGMFNTFSGTVKNIRIENSFVAASNTDWSSKNVRVGGIGGTVTAGATLTNVYMDIEVWYKSHEGCMLGGAFGGADGQYNVDSFIFAGRVGHTNNSFAKSFTLGSGKNMWLGQLTGNQNWKEDNTIKNVAAIGVKFVGAVDSAQSGFIGTDLKWNYKYCYTDKKDLTYSGAQTMLDAGWIWNDTLKCLIPGANESLVENTYKHVVDYTKKFDDVTPAIYFQLSEVENGRYDVRFISGIANIEDPTRVGFDITIHVGGKSYKLAPEYTLSKTVYTSVLAAGNTVEAKDLNEAYDYLFTCAITGIKATDNIIIDVAVVYECEDVTLTGATVSYSFVCGTGHIN